MRRIRRHVTYANVISSLCLFLLLGGGTAVALNGANTVFSDDIVDHQVKPQDLAQLTFTPVRANPLGSNDPCNAKVVGMFCGHNSLSGLRGWENVGQGYAGVAYARDGLGLVHLQGTMYEPVGNDQGHGEAFILPAADRPAAKREFVVAYGQQNFCTGGGCDERHTVVQVQPDGDVVPLYAQPGAGTEFVEGISLDGIDFRAK
jgi:hypothetical protein